MKRPPSTPAQAAIGSGDYRTLAAFRHALRRFLAFSDEVARRKGLTPQQHQAMLAIKGHAPEEVGVGDLAEALLIRHHSAVELIDRLVKAGLVTRSERGDDRRRVGIGLTAKAEAVLDELSAIHLGELRRSRPLLVELLRCLDGPVGAPGPAPD